MRLHHSFVKMLQQVTKRDQMHSEFTTDLCHPQSYRLFLQIPNTSVSVSPLLSLSFSFTNSRSLSLSVYIYAYLFCSYIYIYGYVYMYVYEKSVVDGIQSNLRLVFFIEDYCCASCYVGTELLGWHETGEVVFIIILH